MSLSVQNTPFSAIDTGSLIMEFRQELQDILDWWNHRMVDEVNGGFYGQIDGFGRVHSHENKGVILNARLLWTYAAVGNAKGEAIFRQLADRAYDYFCNHFWDDLQGGVFWTVDYQGNPVDTQKQIYAQAFAIYALTEYYQLTKKQKALDQAMEIFWLVEKYSLDRQKNGYLSAFARGWTHMDDIRLSEKDENEAKIMNTHLHILEAYTNFYRIHPFTALKAALQNIIQLFLNHFYIGENGSMHIYFDEDWNPKGEAISFGHNIEASWLLWEAAEVLGEEALLQKVRRICIHMATAVYESAVDEDGALLYEADSRGITDTDKHWWPQAEAVVGFWNAWQMTGEAHFTTASVNCWAFIKKYLVDKENGEWHWRTDRHGEPFLCEDKAGPWKAPYHNARMCLEMLKRLS